jgi:DNA-binding ferritin-like protein
MFDARNDVPLGVRTKLVRLLKGPNVIAPYELFDTIAEDVAEHSDTLAERATALGRGAHGTLGAAALDARTALADAGTADLFAGISRQLDQDRWFLKAHLHPKR